MKEIIIVDPHSEDFIYIPLIYLLFGRKPLLKYKYISNYVNKSFYITYETSSLPDRIFRVLPFFVKFLIVKFELLLWKKINKINNINFVDDIKDKNLFLFGYKKSKLINSKILKGAKNVFIHLSHYHTFSTNGKVNENVIFCFDNDIKNFSYFKRKFPSYKKNIKIVTFEVQKRFYNSLIETKKNGCCLTGTYHSCNRNDLDWGIYNRNFSTLHPLRHELSYCNLPEYFDSKLSLFKKSSLLKFKMKDIRQSQYFSFDITKYYAGFKFACVPGEGTGAIAIGTLEAMASGCLIFVKKDEIKGLNLNENTYILYDNINELFTKVNKHIEENKFIDFNIIRKEAEKFTGEKLLIKFGEIFENN